MDEFLRFATILTIVSISNPLELVKSRFQTMPELIDHGTIQKRYTSIADCIRRIKINEGLKGLWKGNSIGLARFFPNQMINNAAKNQTKMILPQSVLSNIASGIVGGWTAALILYPIDTARLIISTSNKKSFETLKNIRIKISLEGSRFLLRGFTSSLLSIALFRGTYFGVFDSSKKLVSSQTEKWFAAYLSGLSAGFMVLPMETIRKKKILSQNKGSYSEVFLKTVKSEGIKGFFRGSSLVPFQGLCGATALMYFDSIQKQQ